MERGVPLSHYQLPNSNSGNNQIRNAYLYMYVHACLLRFFSLYKKEVEMVMSSWYNRDFGLKNN